MMEQKYTKRNYKKAPEEPLMGKVQPQAVEVEAAVLGALMLEKEAYSHVADLLKPESFYELKHQKIYEAIQQLESCQKPVDMLTVTEQLKMNDTLDEVGGAYYIAMLTGKVGSAAHIEYHATIVAKKAMARTLISLGSHLVTDAYDETNDTDDLLRSLEGDVFQLTQRNMRNEVVQIDPVIHEALNKIQQASNRADGLSGLPSGFVELDKITSGWQDTDLVVIAARPAMGKTAFVLSMVKNMAVDYKIPVGMFSLEMSNLQLVNRLLQNVCEISGDKVKSGKLTTEEWTQLTTRISQLQGAPIYIDDTPGLSVFELRSKARRLVHDRGVRMIMIDYLQLMTAEGMHFNSREQEVSIISRSLKGLAKELNIPIIALSQLNRGVELRQGDGKRPQLADLRESGAIEQDADMVCFIHRPEKYGLEFDAEGKDMKGVAEIIVAKHRSGQIGDVRLKFRGEFVRFQNPEEDRSFVSTLTKWDAGDGETLTSKMDNDSSFDISPLEKVDF